jgi:hypothetical protein
MARFSDLTPAGKIVVGIGLVSGFFGVGSVALGWSNGWFVGIGGVVFSLVVITVTQIRDKGGW